MARIIDQARLLADVYIQQQQGKLQDKHTGATILRSITHYGSVQGSCIGKEQAAIGFSTLEKE